MDLRTPPTTVTEAGRGYQPGRTYVGHFYKPNSHHMAHYNLFCKNQKETDYDHVPVFEEDGKLFTLNKNNEQRNATVTLCPDCPDFNKVGTDWRESAACDNEMDARFFSPTDWHKAKAEFCDRCPVQVQCFEYGALAPHRNQGATWGGVYFSTKTRQRDKAIEKRKRELGLG